jgi:RNA polymerase sigma-70 factor, ECF subfamily
LDRHNPAGGFTYRSETGMHASAVQRAVEDGEQELIRRAGAGDEQAFRELMERHGAHAMGVALRITRSREDAEDVTQQAFVRAWHALGSFRGESSFSTWLHRIVARQALDRASELKARRAREEELDVATLPSIGSTTRDVILLRRLEQLMGRLSAAQRAVLTLHYWDELTVEEIGTALAMPVNTVKTHLSRARAALREAWLRTEGRR